MANEFQAVVVKEVHDVVHPVGEEVVEAADFVAFFEKAFAELGANESGTAGNENANRT